MGRVASLPDGVKIKVFVGNQQLVVNANNQVLGVRPKDTMRFYVVVEDRPEVNVFSIRVEGERHLPVAVEDCSHEFADLRSGSRVFGITVPASQDSKKFRLDHTASCLRILELAQDGSFTLSQVGLVCQGGSIFLHNQVSFSGQCFEDGGYLKAPAVGKWESLQLHMAELLGKNVAGLPALSSYKVPVMPCVDMPARQGQIEWFNPWQGFGIAHLSNGKKARVHWTGIEGTQRGQLICLNRGDVVLFDRIVASAEPGGMSQLEKVKLFREVAMVH